MEKQSRSLFFLTVIYTLGNLSSKLISFVLVFFTTYYLTREEVGAFDLILITVNLLIPLVSLQLSDAGLRWLLGTEEEGFDEKKTISSIFFFLCGVSVLFSAVYQAYVFIVPSSYSIYINALLIIHILYIFFQQSIRGLGFNKLYASNSVINAFLYSGIAIFLLVRYDLKVEGLLIANIVALLVTGVQLFFRAKLYRYISFPNFSWSHLKRMINYSLPLMPNSLSWWAMSSANRYFIMFFVGVVANGIFAISYKVPTIVTMFVGIFSLAWQEKSILTFDSDERDKYYSDVFKKFLCVLFSISYIIVATNQLFIKVAVSEQFFEAYRYTPILILSTIFNSIAGFYGTGFLGAKKTKGLLTSSIIGGLTSVILSLLLIPHFGLYGASFSILLGYLVLMCLRVFQSKKLFKIDFSRKSFTIYIFLFIAVSAIGYFENIYANVFNILFAVSIAYFFNKNLIRSVYRAGVIKIKKII